jgi:hypothetical protein
MTGNVYQLMLFVENACKVLKFYDSLVRKKYKYCASGYLVCVEYAGEG